MCAFSAQTDLWARPSGENSSFGERHFVAPDRPPAKKLELPTPVVPEAPPPPPRAEAEAKRPDAFAEPVSPVTIARYPHLRPFQGQVVIGGKNLQIVLAGVPPKAPTEAWQTAVLAVFERRDQRFVRSAALETLELKNGDANRSAYYPIGIDLGMERSQHLAFVTLIYSTSGPKAPRQTLTWRFDAITEQLTVAIDDFAGGKIHDSGHWQLRLTGPKAQTLAGPGYWIQGAAADVAAILPFRNLTAKTTSAGLELTPEDGEAPPVEGFELLLGRGAAARVLTRSVALKTCLYGVLRPRKPLKEEAKADWLLGCQPIGTKATLRLVTSVKDPSEITRPLFVFGESGEPLLYSALEGVKDVVELSLPAAANYQLADTPAGRLIEGVGGLGLVDGQTRTVEVPGYASGFLRIYPGAAASAALLKLERLDHRSGGDAAVVKPEEGDALLALQSDLFLVRSWPVDLELASGGYSLTLARGKDGAFCQLKAQIVKERRTSLDCREAAPTAARLPGADELSFVDLATLQGRDMPVASLRQALGVDFIAEPVDLASAKPAALRVLRVEDETTAMTLAFLPATTALASHWEKLRHVRAPDDLPVRFGRFVREEGGEGLLELGCPGPGVTPFDYELLVERLQPDALRLFGCGGGANQEVWLALYDQLSAARHAPYLLTTAPGLGGDGANFSRLVVHSPVAAFTEHPEALARALGEGRYEISAGGLIELKELKRAQPKTGRTLKGKAFDLVAELGYGVRPGVRATALAFYGDKGLILKYPLSDTKEQANVSVVVPGLKASTMVRVELLGGRGVLATTNAQLVSGLVAKEQETH